MDVCSGLHAFSFPSSDLVGAGVLGNSWALFIIPQVQLTTLSAIEPIFIHVYSEVA